jgi:hypothetical protein
MNYRKLKNYNSITHENYNGITHENYDGTRYDLTKGDVRDLNWFVDLKCAVDLTNKTNWNNMQVANCKKYLEEHPDDQLTIVDQGDQGGLLMAVIPKDDESDLIKGDPKEFLKYCMNYPRQLHVPGSAENKRQVDVCCNAYCDYQPNKNKCMNRCEM